MFLMAPAFAHRLPASRVWALWCAALLISLVAACDDADVGSDPGSDPPDVLEDAGEDADPGDTEDVDDTEELPPEEGWRPLFDPEGEGFYRIPWPLDSRRQADGRLLLEDFPLAQRQGLVRSYRRELEANARGFSTMPVVYIAFEDQVGPPPSLFPTPAESLTSSSPLLLMALDGDRCGERVPIETVRQENERDQFLPRHTLMSAPVPGFLLEPSSTYAFVMRQAFSEDIKRPALLDALLSDTPGEAPDIHDAFAPLRACWDSLGESREDIVMATVFTTDDPIAETIRLRAEVLDTERTAAPALTEWEEAPDRLQSPDWTAWLGTYETPMFQRGDTPYTNSGGGLEFDEQGRPILQRWEEVPFSVAVPEGDGPFPVLLWSDGTGATRTSHLFGSVFRAMIREGFVVVAFDAQFHGERSRRASPGATDDLSTFNYFNPEAGRTNFRQQLADTVYFLRVIRELLPTLEDLPELDTTRIVFGGQSQGSLVGAMLAGVEDGIEAYALNGVGSYLSLTIMDRKDPIDIAQTIATVLNIRGGGLSRFHPVVQLAQLGSDPVDPGNYARFYAGSEAMPEGVHMLTVNGLSDDAVPYRCADALAISGRLAPLAPAGWDADPEGVWDLTPEASPVAGNRTALSGRSLTHATVMDANQGHFTIFRSEPAREAFIRFLVLARDGDVPEVRLGQ